MIDPIPIAVKYTKGKQLFASIKNIEVTDKATIKIVDTVENPLEPEKYYVANLVGLEPTPELFWFANVVNEVWVESWIHKVAYKRAGVTRPIIIMTTDTQLLPYCMKDRLASLQDRLNKIKVKLDDWKKLIT